MGEPAPLSGPDLTKGVPQSEVPEGGMLLGQANGEAVILVRRGEEVRAVGGVCSHYSAPLADGIVVGNEVRCPYHHACFDLRTGEALGPPALSPIPCYDVERKGDRLFVVGKRAPVSKPALKGGPESVVIAGAGAAGNSAAETLRNEGYTGKLTLIGAEDTVPVDRPNLSKDTLAGTAPEAWVPLRDRAFYADRGIELVLGKRVARIDPAAKRVTLDDGATHSYGALLLATGADPIRLDLPGKDREHVLYLRSLADCQRIMAKLGESKVAVVAGASFIGLEVAASLRIRGLEVHVVAPEARPLERIMGPELGDFVRALHEEHGVHFHLGAGLKSIEEKSVTTSSGESIAADLVVLGVGVRPALALAEQAGLKLDKGVVVDAQLRTSDPAIWAAGDIARWPDPHSGQPIRVEHWAVAQRQGMVAARNMLGRGEAFRAVPFFWSQHYDVPINYVGHAERWDRIEIAGNIADKNCLVAFHSAGKIVAVATIYRDKESLQVEAALERDDQPALAAIMKAAR
jgi:NADPH-dependent 2,4-dienoyl-CoA reductase/sulfur reductase-like enzyme/nitrite reductase/ring-hydroxylating ferredoxin subunit